MSEHKHKFGIQIIDKFFKLGKILNYHCEKEYIVDENNRSKVDIAWLFERGQKYPLFIFEVESKTTNSIFANPSKIFGESNQKFEKPLFLFHLLLTGGKDSGKVTQLENLFGKHNYRTYRFDLEEEINLILDILSQHRRLTNSLNIISLIDELLENWENLDIKKIIEHIESLEFEKDTGQLLPSYAHLYKKHKVMKTYFIKRLKLKLDTTNGLNEYEDFDTYLGNNWSIPIYLGILAAFAEDGNENKYFEELKKWQEKSQYMTQIGPHYGLSQDYYLFILGMAGSVWGLTAALFSKFLEAREYIANQLYYILKKSSQFDTSINSFNAIWLIHISPDSEIGKECYNYAKDLINSEGTVAEEFFLNPGFNYGSYILGEGDSQKYKNSPRIEIPTWEKIREMKRKVKINDDILFEIAINYLIENEDNWNPIRAGQL